MKTKQMNGFTDIHTHILPGVDDGAENVEKAMNLVRMAYKDGTRTIFLTPHYRGRYRQHSTEHLREVFCSFSRMVQEEFPDLTVFLGSEIHYEIDAPEQLAAGEMLSLCDSEYCLLEFRPSVLRSQVIIGISEIIRNGYTPIIAHAERYEIFVEDKSLTNEVLDMGALIQLNAGSVLGKSGWKVKLFCNRLLKAQQVHFIASDAHDEGKRPPLLRDCWWKIYRQYGVEYANRLFFYNAQLIIDHKTI